MPHRCVKCGKLFPDGAKQLLLGCDECGSRFFYYLKEEALTQKVKELTNGELKEIEKDIKEITGVKELEMPVVLDLETVRMSKPGKYEIDLVKLFKNQPIVFKIKDGKYIIDLSLRVK